MVYHFHVLRCLYRWESLAGTTKTLAQASEFTLGDSIIKILNSN